MEKKEKIMRKPSEIVHFDKILVKYLGEFGRYQVFILLTLCLVGFATSAHQLAHVFLAAIPDYWCHVDNCTWTAQREVCGDYNLNRWDCEEAIVDYTSPMDDGDTKTLDERQCRVYSNVTCDHWAPNITFEDDSSVYTECKDGWDYDQSTYESSVVTQFDLVCTNAYLESLASSIFLAGLMVGVPLNGALADKFGRKRILLITLMTLIIFGIITAFSVNYTMFVIGRFIIGTAANSSYILAFVIISEFVGPSKRVAATVPIFLAFGIGSAILTVTAYFLRDWRVLELAISIPYILLWLFYLCFIPESPRWLLSKADRVEEGIEVIEKVAKANRVTLPEDVLDPRLYEDMKDDDDDDDEEEEGEEEGDRRGLETPMKEKNSNGTFSEKESKPNGVKSSNEERKKKHTVFDLFRLPNMRKKTLVLYYLWFVAGLVFYGLSLNTSNLGGSDYMNAFISAMVEIPGTLLGWWAMDVRWIGRVKTLAFALIFSGVACIITPFPPQIWLSTTFAMIGKMFSKTMFNGVYIVAAEIFPTSVRSVGMGSSSMWARVGSILAPQLIFIGQTWRPLPYFVYGGASILGGLLTFLLPETLGKRLPKTLAEGEAFGKKKKHKTTKALVYKNASIQTDKELGIENICFEN